MKLYYAPGACSLSPHIVSRELRHPARAEEGQQQGQDHRRRRRLLEGQPEGLCARARARRRPVLTEGPAIVQYLADRKAEAGLAPKAGTLERYRLQEWLNFLTSEVHKQFWPLFKPNTPEEYKAIAKQNIAARFDWIDKSSPARTTSWASRSPSPTPTSSRCSAGPSRPGSISPGGRPALRVPQARRRAAQGPGSACRRKVCSRTAA